MKSGPQAEKVWAKCQGYKRPADVPGAFIGRNVAELKKHGLPVFFIGLNEEFYPSPYKLTKSIYEDFVTFCSSASWQKDEWVEQNNMWFPSTSHTCWFLPASFLEEANELGEISL